MATIDTAHQLFNVLTGAGNGNSLVNSRSPNDQAAYATCVAQLNNAINGFAQINSSPPQGFTAQAQLLAGWTFNYQAAFLAADLTARSALRAAAQSVPGALAFDTTSATNATLVARLASAKSFTAATSTSILQALASATATLAQTFAGQPAQNDATALAALQSAATTALAAAVTDATAMASFVGQTTLS
jgi:hypothetical protein